MVDDQGNVIEPRFPRRARFPQLPASQDMVPANARYANPYNPQGQIVTGFTRPRNAGQFGYSRYGEPYSRQDVIGTVMQGRSFNTPDPNYRPRQFWGQPLGQPLRRSDLTTITLPSGGTATVPTSSRTAQKYLANQPRMNPQESYQLGFTGVPTDTPRTAFQKSYNLGYTGGREGGGVTMPSTAPFAASAIGNLALRGLSGLGSGVSNLANLFWQNYLKSRDLQYGSF